MSVLHFLLLLFKAVPAIKLAFDELVAVYIALKVSEMKRENRDAIRKALNAFDQRDIEKAIGNPTPGAPSNLDGVEYVDNLPGVRN